MKKKLIWVMTIAVVVVASLTFASCMPKVTGGDANIADDYNAAGVNAKMDEMRTGGGFRLVFKGTADAEEGTDEVTYVYAANNDTYYYSTNDEQTYFDLSNAEFAAEYHKNGNEEWTKVVTYYDATFTKENEKENIRNSAEAVFNWMLFYDEEENTEDSGGMAKESGEIAGRSCDKYSWGMSFMGVKVTYACWIDQATGICLRWNASASAFGQGGGANFECQTFETSYTFGALPTVSEENTTINNKPNDNVSSIANDYPNIASVLSTLIALGVEMEFDVTASGATEAYKVKLAAKGDIFYAFNAGKQEEVYLDVSKEESYDLYTKDGEEWKVETNSYADAEGKFANKTELIASYSDAIKTIIDLALTRKDARLTKTTIEFCGRQVDKYEGTVENNIAGNVRVEIYVDQATGMVLFDQTTATVAGVAALSGTYRCTSFKTGDGVTLTLPDVE